MVGANAQFTPLERKKLDLGKRRAELAELQKKLHSQPHNVEILAQISNLRKQISAVEVEINEVTSPKATPPKPVTIPRSDEIEMRSLQSKIEDLAKKIKRHGLDKILMAQRSVFIK